MSKGQGPIWVSRFIAEHRLSQGKRTYKTTFHVWHLRETKGKAEEWGKYLHEAGGMRGYRRWRNLVNKSQRGDLDWQFARTPDDGGFSKGWWGNMENVIQRGKQSMKQPYSGAMLYFPKSTRKMKRKNPRKISVEAADALMEGYEYKKDNTKVVQVKEDPTGETFHLILHGSVIAQYDIGEDWLSIRTAGYPTATTKERLNALPGVRVQTKKGQLYLNGRKWDGERIEVT